MSRRRYTWQMTVFPFLGEKNPEEAVGRKQAAGIQSKPVTKNGRKNHVEFIKIYKSRNK